MKRPFQDFYLEALIVCDAKLNMIKQPIRNDSCSTNRLLQLTRVSNDKGPNTWKP